MGATTGIAYSFMTNELEDLMKKNRYVNCNYNALQFGEKYKLSCGPDWYMILHRAKYKMLKLPLITGCI